MTREDLTMYLALADLEAAQARQASLLNSLRKLAADRSLFSPILNSERPLHAAYEAAVEDAKRKQLVFSALRGLRDDVAARAAADAD